MYKVAVSRRAAKDYRLLKQAKLHKKAELYMQIVKNNPFHTPPSYKKLTGDMAKYYSRRINDQHRFVYEVLPNDTNLVDENNVPYTGIVKILRMWTHYE
ncbi:MAG: Txe/YoeB family addiction module toxin [Turicibacter sp.]|nr:Txe/YoeB family addiction module toxin [Turicibacter sp.]